MQWVEKNMPFSVIAMVWLEERRAFLFKCFIKTESYVAVKCAIRKKFKLKRHDSIRFHRVSLLISG